MMRLLRPWLPLMAGLILVPAALVLSSGSGLIAKKVIAMLMLPAGMLWLAGLAALLWPGRSWVGRIVLAAAWFTYSAAGRPYAGVQLLRTLEGRYYAHEQLSEPLDAMVLLGGGTLRSPGGKPAMGKHGDRIYQPVSWYRKGMVETLITTGRSVTESGDDRLLSEETATIWMTLGIPRSAILEVPEPRNTSEELRAVAEIVREREEWRRIGLCSSASHLPRALREARKQGLDLVPVPSDFRSQPLVLSPLYLIPQARGFRDVQTALWEYLGMWAP